MSEGFRAFVVSAHGTLHRPDCHRVRALRNPKRVNLTPYEVGGSGVYYALAECCWRYGATRPIARLEWSSEETDQ